jgi:transglutaminase-like putative cysteine protease
MTAIGPLGPAREGMLVGQAARLERTAALRCWLAFGALALYGALRWATMVTGSERGRVFLSLALALALAALLRRLVDGPVRWASPGWLWILSPAIVLVVAALVLIGVAGFPLHLLFGGHLDAFGSALSDGISGLPGLLVPYIGDDPLIAAGLVLGGAALLVAASLVFGTASATPSVGRLALAALPLVVLATVPSAIVTPRYVSLHGLLTFVLVAGLIFAPRLALGRLGAATLLVGLAAAIGTLGAGVIPGDHRWSDLATGPSASGTGTGSGSGGAERFNWQQTYGALGWPYSGATVLTVSAPAATLWKAEVLDDFTGSGWVQAAQPVLDDGSLDGVSGATITRYTENLRVKVGQLNSKNVIAAGYVDDPDVPGAEPGVDPGSWVTDEPLHPGESYDVAAYVPRPAGTQLVGAGTDYPEAVQPFRQLERLPSAPYAGVETLARRLGAGVSTPYGYVQAVMAYLQRRYVYTLDPPSGGSYPLARFLLDTRQGYCQQFAGAMALLLRMKGVPARVAVGFSPGTRQSNSRRYEIEDQDAHAWVEVWFPGYGWVSFDPTPGRPGTGTGGVPTTPAAAAAAGAAAAGATTPATTTTGAGVTTTAQILTQTVNASGTHSQTTAVGRRTASADSALLVVIALGIVGALGLALLAHFGSAYLRRPSTTELTEEIERAFARCGRPLGAELTLTALAARLSDAPDAAAYLQSLADARYGALESRPPAGGRAALRGWLARGAGPAGRLRALWALPPRRTAVQP